MALRKDSSKTESITVRVPRELMDKARQAVPGAGNTAVILTALRVLCGESDSMPPTALQEITERLAELEKEVDNLKKPSPDRTYRLT